MTHKVDFRIIVIDDNPSIQHDFIKILIENNHTPSELNFLSESLFGKKKEEDFSLPIFEITTASQGQEGVELIKKGLKEKKPYALAFVDIRMPPGWDGIETIKHIWELDKDIQVVICTAYSDYSWEDTVAHLGKTDNLLILKKPFDYVAVRQLTCALTKKWQLLQDVHKYTTSLEKEIKERTFSLQNSLSLLQATLESSNDGILVINDQGKIVNLNQKFLTLWNIPNDWVKSNDDQKIFTFLKNQLINSEEFEKKLQSISTHQATVNLEVYHLKNGSIFECFSQPQKLNEQTVGLVLNFHDITERAKLEKELEFQANHDALTGLPNRIMLLNHIHQAIKLSEKNHSYFAIMFLDLDRFKLINDSLSHAVGDELLQATAHRLHAIMRKEDTLARLGGDEFVILITNFLNEAQARQKADEIIEVFKKPFKFAGREVIVTASIGISLYPKNGTNIDVLLRNADAAMYRAKEVGSNNYQFYSEEMNAHTLNNLETETQLRQAISHGELFLCYQPQLDLSLDKIIAVEALVRWNHPEKGILLPMDFIPTAEKSGLIVSIGEWILRTACQQNKKWQDEGLPPIRMAVNVTMQQFKQQNMVQLIKDILKETSLAPEYLELELTENVIINSSDIVEMINKLKNLGVRIAVDDFGTGYSSLSYLRKIPLDRLKIDSSFIQNIHTQSDDDVIIRAVIAMANSLNLEVLAEGVETKNQLNFLRKNKCSEIQGFYFSKPLTAEELEVTLKNPEETKIKMLQEEKV